MSFASLGLDPRTPQLVARAKPLDRADLGDEKERAKEAHPRNGVQRFDHRMIATESLDLFVELTDLGGHCIVQAQQSIDLAPEGR